MLTETEREELLDDLMLRIAVRDKEQMKVSQAKNNSTLRGMTKIYQEFTDRYYDKLASHDRCYTKSDAAFNFHNMYEAYTAVRKLIPIVVGVKRSFQGMTDRKTYVLNPEVDQEEAETIGRLLMETIFDYCVQGSTEKRRDE